VIIDKLPFAPDDPLLAARLDYIGRRGGIRSSIITCRKP
jgi:Rad3-related DNA helicase